jgi:hypothetical protein
MLQTLILAAALADPSAIVSAPAPAPVKPHFDRIDFALIASDVAVRTLDTYSTRRMLNQGNHELFLPDCISHSTPAMAAFSGAVVASNVLAARYLIHHHHPKLAKAMLAVDVAQDAPWAVHNLYLPNHRRR